MLDETRKYYVYVWFIKETKEVFYVGKGNGICVDNKTYMLISHYINSPYYQEW